MTTPAAGVPPSLEAALRDRFPIERELGEGGMATVYLARDLRHDRLVAVKVLKPEVGVLLGRERFEQEVRLASSLSHPNIVPVYDSGEAAGFLYYVMPAVEGESLATRIERERYIGIEEAVRLLGEAADALDYAHARGVVHRDIKPGNILLLGGHAMVADLGIALALSKVEGKRLTETGLSMGTPSYMSPEQAAGHRVVDGRSDQYSLACVFYEMLGGDPPFTGSTPRSVMARHVADPPPSLMTLRPGLPEGVETAVKRALSKIPVDRFETCGAFARTVAAAASGAVVSTPRGRGRRVPWRLVGGAVGAAVLGLTAWSALTLWPASDAIRTIALLPPDNGTRDTAQLYRVEGMFEQVVTAVAKVPELRIKPATAARPYWDSRHSITDVVRGLDVDAVLQTSVFPGADSVRLTLRLIRGATQDIAWTLDTMVGWAQVLRASDAAARGLATAAHARLTRSEAARLASARTVDPAAYDLVIRARVTRDLPRKRALLLQAIERDGAFAQAYAELAQTLIHLTQYGFARPDDVGAQAVAAAERAVQLDSMHADVWRAKAAVAFWIQWDIAAANRSSERARALGGASFQTMLLLTGRVDEAIPIYDQLAEDDPLSGVASLNRCWSRIQAHRFREAIPFCRQTAAAHPGDDASWARLETAWAFAALGMGDSALAEIAATGMDPEGVDDIVALGSLAFVYAQSGRPAQARRLTERLARLTGPRQDPYNLACAYAAIGDDARALELFERVFSERWPTMMFASVEPLLPARFRALPQFQDLLRRAGLPPGGPASAAPAS